MTIGERIKEVRIKKGLSQKELGKQLGVSQQMIGQYENPNSNLKTETVSRIAEALEVSTISLLLGTPSELKEEFYSSQKNEEAELMENYNVLNEAGRKEELVGAHPAAEGPHLTPGRHHREVLRRQRPGGRARRPRRGTAAAWSG